MTLRLRRDAAFDWCERAAIGLAFGRALLGLLCYPLVVYYFPNSVSATTHTLAFQIALFGGSAFFVRRMAPDDERARLLAAVFIACANAYTTGLVQPMIHMASPPWSWICTVAWAIRVDAFLPLFLWKFVEVFPTTRISHPFFHASNALRRIALGLGIFFNVIAGIRAIRFLGGFTIPIWPDAIVLLLDKQWEILIPLIVAAAPFLLLKRQRLSADERRRVLLTVIAISLFCHGMLELLLEELFPSLPWWDRTATFYGRSRFFLGNALYALFPILMTYTIRAHRVLDVASVARNAVRYVLTRYSAAALGFVPFVFIVYFGWTHRESTLVELFSGSPAIVLSTAFLLGALALIYRQPVLDYIDRRFFTERYNSRRVLTELVEQVRGTRNLVELAKLVERGVDLALHLERVALMVEDPAVGRFVDPRHQVRPLDPGSQLITLVSGSRDPIAVDLEAPSSPFRSLPEDDKLWLLENRVEMIAPAHSLDGNLIAVLVLGAKKSELPFLLEDRELLAGVCSSAGLVVELLRLKETSSPVASPPSLNERFEAAAAVEADGNDGGNAEAAMECIACDRVFPPGTAECPNCFVDTEKTNAPYILRDLYRLDHRLGAGGMAVVYRAKDLKLGRTVAIKTLPRVNAEAAMRLRREARTAASVTHPGLAAIYGLETWRGVPMIITEYLAGGTLADQLGQDPLDPLTAIDMASTVAQALAKIHTAGILHRDIKPSNIGYTEDGDVKLLDFGIARIQHDFRKERPDDENTAPGPDGSRIVNTASLMLPRTRTGQLVGTVTYLSPEAARGEKADTGVDLWALAVCLYESLTAENLFYGRNFQDVLGKIRDQRIADVRQKAPTCPEPLALFLAEELHLDRSRRSEDGLEMASRLRIVRAKILA